jgi:hypothetical protein
MYNLNEREEVVSRVCPVKMRAAKSLQPLFFDMVYSVLFHKMENSTLCGRYVRLSVRDPVSPLGRMKFDIENVY